MKHIGLFEGIGGFSLAAAWMGWETIAWCEINPFCQQILKFYFHEAKAHQDIKQTDFTVYRGRCDVLTGGFPCQPYSAAGKQLGKADDRHLWPSMLRAIREIQPRWVVGENVRGLVTWNGGMVFDEVQSDLENEGYEILPFLLPACGVNAPHRRDRIWFIAYANGYGNRIDRKQDGKAGSVPGDNRPEVHPGQSTGTDTPPAPDSGSDGQQYGRPGKDRPAQAEGEGQGVQRERVRGDLGRTGEQDATAYTKSLREHRAQEHENDSRQGGERGRRDADDVSEVQGGGSTANAPGVGVEGHRPDREQEPYLPPRAELLRRDRSTDGWQDWPTQPPLCWRDDGLPAGLVGITIPKHRNESIKGYGNSIVPEVALQLLKAIDQYEKKFANQ